MTILWHPFGRNLITEYNQSDVVNILSELKVVSIYSLV